MKKHPKLEERRKKITDEVKAFVDKSFAISEQIDILLNKHGLTQKELARLLNKSESEISKWMSGTHNFTINSLTNIERVLGESIILCPYQIPLRYTSILMGSLAQANVNIIPPSGHNKISWEKKTISYHSSLSVNN